MSVKIHHHMCTYACCSLHVLGVRSTTKRARTHAATCTSMGCAGKINPWYMLCCVCIMLVYAHAQKHPLRAAHYPVVALSLCSCKAAVPARPPRMCRAFILSRLQAVFASIVGAKAMTGLPAWWWLELHGVPVGMLAWAPQHRARGES